MKTDSNSVSSKIFHYLATLPGKAGITLIKLYRATAPLRPAMCRYKPSCSEYALQSIQRYGLVSGCALTFRRILKCNPFTIGGYDPIPPTLNEKLQSSSMFGEKNR